MTLKEITENLSPLETQGEIEKEISGLALDSRKVLPGFLFFAVRGSNADGHDFIDTAIKNGATAIACENIPEKTYDGVTYIKFYKTNDVLGQIASRFYGDPSKKLLVIGVTGTNGKTTVATMLYDLFTSLGLKSGLLSTVENKIGEETFTSTHTTGDALQVQENLAKMRDAGCKHVFMEVSSHSIDQGRINGINFVSGIFTNLTQDHLDYHKDMESYANAKKAFFDNLPEDSFALYNADDGYGEFMVSETKSKKISYGEKSKDFKLEINDSKSFGLDILIGGEQIKSPLVGRFNAYNLCAIYATALTLGISSRDLSEKIESLYGARGRMEKIVGENGIIGIVDYAHTPDAIQNVLETINDFKTGRVITVFGAGGDRDKTKRPIMGEIATRLSDVVIITTDNPRSEESSDIADDIFAGALEKGKVKIVLDRLEAIKMAVSIAVKGDIILLAGKGHENYQEIKGIKSHFDDKEVLIDLLK